MTREGKLISDGFGYWLAGLTDGEGTFNIVTDPHVGFRFQINLRQDDIPTLQYIQKNVGFGKIYIRKVCNKPTYSKNGDIYQSKPSAAFSVQKRKDLSAINNIFKKYPLQSKKGHDFEIWSTALDYYLSRPFGSKRTSMEKTYFREAFQKLRSVREYQAMA